MAQGGRKVFVAALLALVVVSAFGAQACLAADGDRRARRLVRRRLRRQGRHCAGGGHRRGPSCLAAGHSRWAASARRRSEHGQRTSRTAHEVAASSSSSRKGSPSTASSWESCFGRSSSRSYEVPLSRHRRRGHGPRLPVRRRCPGSPSADRAEALAALKSARETEGGRRHPHAGSRRDDAGGGGCAPVRRRFCRWWWRFPGARGPLPGRKSLSDVIRQAIGVKV